MEEFHKALLEKKYVISAKQLEKARHSADSLKAWKGSELPLLRALSSELTVQRENLIYHLGDEWKRLAVWKLPPSKGKKATRHHIEYGRPWADVWPHNDMPQVLDHEVLESSISRALVLRISRLPEVSAALQRVQHGILRYKYII